MLVVVCSNSGNYGLPVALLAFGREALTFASVYFVSSADLQLHGRRPAGRERTPIDRATRSSESLRVPAVYGAVAAALTHEPRHPRARRRHRGR